MGKVILDKHRGHQLIPIGNRLDNSIQVGNLILHLGLPCHHGLHKILYPELNPGIDNQKGLPRVVLTKGHKLVPEAKLMYRVVLNLLYQDLSQLEFCLLGVEGEVVQDE